MEMAVCSGSERKDASDHLSYLFIYFGGLVAHPTPRAIRVHEVLHLIRPCPCSPQSSRNQNVLHSFWKVHQVKLWRAGRGRGESKTEQEHLYACMSFVVLISALPESL